LPFFDVRGLRLIPSSNASAILACIFLQGRAPERLGSPLGRQRWRLHPGQDHLLDARLELLDSAPQPGRVPPGELRKRLHRFVEIAIEAGLIPPCIREMRKQQKF
jgi:hypothetical protein